MDKSTKQSIEKFKRTLEERRLRCTAKKQSDDSNTTKKAVKLKCTHLMRDHTFV